MATLKLLLIKLKPKNDPKEFFKMLQEFDALDETLDGMVTLPETHTKVTDEGHLLFLFPHRLDFAVACEPGEFQELTQREVDSDEYKAEQQAKIERARDAGEAGYVTEQLAEDFFAEVEANPEIGIAEALKVAKEKQTQL